MTSCTDLLGALKEKGHLGRWEFAARRSKIAVNHLGPLVKALELRQGYLCCYPPEPCERCRADAELLAGLRRDLEAALEPQ